MNTLPTMLGLPCPVCAGRRWHSQMTVHTCLDCGARCALRADFLIMEWLPAELSLAGSEDAKVRVSEPISLDDAPWRATEGP